jgi:hypothetical protein
MLGRVVELSICILPGHSYFVLHCSRSGLPKHRIIVGQSTDYRQLLLVLKIQIVFRESFILDEFFYVFL